MNQGRVWAARLASDTGQRVAALRASRQMTAQELAQRCANLGFPELSRLVITKLENGRREGLSVAELLVLAAALEVSPAELAFPFGASLCASVLPDVQATVLDAAQWLGGFARLDHSGRIVAANGGRSTETSVQMYASHRDAEKTLLDVLDRRSSMLGQPDVQRALTGDLGEEARRSALGAEDSLRRHGEEFLRRLRADMERRGLPLPELPDRIRYVDSPNGGSDGSH